MAFRSFSADPQNPMRLGQSEQAAPQLTQLQLELVPPVLCQSFGVPMCDTQPVQRSILGVSVQQALMASGQQFGSGSTTEPLSGVGPQAQYPMSAFSPYGQMPSHAGSLQQAGGGMDANTYGRMLQQYAAAHTSNSAFQQQQPQSSFQQYRPISFAGQGLPQQSTYHSGQFASPSPQEQRASGFSQPSTLDSSWQHASAGSQPVNEPPAAVTGHLDIDIGRKTKRATDPGTMEPVKRSRLVWTRELHKCFEVAVDKAGGIDVAVPKTVLELMGVSGLTRDNVASHLQKHRMHIKKGKDDASVQPASALPATRPASVAAQQNTATSETTTSRPAQRSSTECDEPCSAAGAAAIQSHAAATNGEAAMIKAASTKDQPDSSTHFTSDSGSRKTAFIAMRSGVMSAPDSQLTCGGARVDLSLAPHSTNMASSAPVAAKLPHAAEPVRDFGDFGSAHMEQRLR